MKGRKQRKKNKWEKMRCMKSCIPTEARGGGGKSQGTALEKKVVMGIIWGFLDA